VSVVKGERVLIDPFNGGALVDHDQLARLLTSALGRGSASAAEHLAPMGNRAVLVRLLINQATRAEQAGRHNRALSIFRRITTIAPAFTHGWWDRSRLELVKGDVSAARASLSAMLETTRDHDLRTHINAALDAIAG
jgi:regulator of sirC expression with transglutaminase-like and TPR domain